MTQKNSVVISHPGALLREKIITNNDLTLKRAAELLGITNVQLCYTTKGRCDLTPEMCQRLAVVFGENAEDWMALQAKYDLQKASAKINKLKLKTFKTELR